MLGKIPYIGPKEVRNNEDLALSIFSTIGTVLVIIWYPKCHSERKNPYIGPNVAPKSKKDLSILYHTCVFIAVFCCLALSIFSTIGTVLGKIWYPTCHMNSRTPYNGPKSLSLLYHSCVFWYDTQHAIWRKIPYIGLKETQKNCIYLALSIFSNKDIVFIIIWYPTWHVGNLWWWCNFLFHLVKNIKKILI